MLRQRRLSGLVALLVFAAVLAGPSALSDDRLKRTVLRQADLTGVDGIEVIVTLIEAEPGAGIALHTHHGDEFLYVLEGGMIQPKGKEPVPMKAGQSLHFPRGMVHGGFTVVGDKTLKVLTTHVVDKGKPLAVPAD